MKRTIKNRILMKCIIIGIIIIILGIVLANNSKKISLIEFPVKQKTLTEDKYNNVQKAIREVANAYYNVGINAQYCTNKQSRFYSPEEGTLQHNIYSTCSDFTFSVYYQAFGIKIPPNTNEIIAYAANYYDCNNTKTNDLVEYWKRTIDENGNRVYTDNIGNKKDIDLLTESGKNNYVSKILKEYDLQVGDLICYHRGIENDNTGHVVLVYDIVYNENGEPVDAVIREAASKFEKKTTKITRGVSYGNVYNENNNVNEGTFKERYLASTYNTSSTVKRGSLVDSFADMSYFTIFRPLLKDENGNYTGKYYLANFASQAGTPPSGVICTGRTATDYEMLSSTLNRITYSKIDIRKTVDVFNGSTVDLGDTLEYTIKIANNSDTEYKNFDVLENISDYTEVLNSANGFIAGNNVKWNIQSLGAKQSIELKYTVKVKEDISCLGKKIVSTGTVAGIPSSTVSNYIFTNLNKNEKLAIANKTQSIINTNSYSGQELITKIYQEALGINYKIDNLNITDLIKVRNGTAYFPLNWTSAPTIYLNEENIFSKTMLNNYYGALYTNSSGTVSLKSWENAGNNYESFGYRSERADTIYKENFQTGDILIYKNSQVANGNVNYKTENGTYYLIYISEEDKITLQGQDIFGFVGLDENKQINQISTDFTSMQTLLGKDYYVILRPSMAKLRIDIEDYSERNENEKKYIENVAPKTTLEEFINKINTNGDKQVLKADTKITDNEKKISTGMKLIISLNNEIVEYTVVVKGDTNGDGECDLKDLLQVNKHRLNKTQLKDEYLRAGDVNNDNTTNIKDILQINKFRLEKIKSL